MTEHILDSLMNVYIYRALIIIKEHKGETPKGHEWEFRLLKIISDSYSTLGHE